MHRLPSEGCGPHSPRSVWSEADYTELRTRQRFLSVDNDFHTPQTGRRNAGYREKSEAVAMRLSSITGLTLSPRTLNSQNRSPSSTPASGSVLSFLRESLSAGWPRISSATSFSSDSIFSGCSSPSQKTNNTFSETPWNMDKESSDCPSNRSESVPEESDNSTDANKNSSQVPIPFVQLGLKLPFCEEYDGVNMRKTKTISESIVALLQAQQEEQWQSEMADFEDSDGIDIVYRSSQYFDRLREIHEIIVAKTDPVLGDAPTTPVSVTSLPLLSCKPTVTASTSLPLPEPKLSKETIEQSTAGVDISHGASLFPDMNSECGSENLEIGSVDLKIKYISEKESLQVTMLKAEDIIDPTENEQKINPFIKLSIYQRNKRKKRTRVVWKSRNPVFTETFHLHDIVEKWLHVTSLLVELFHKKRFGSRCLGAALIWLDDLDLADGNEEFVTEIFKTYLH